MTRLRRHLTYANVTSTLCLFIVLGGVGYAAATLPRNSVGTKQLKRNAVTSAKVKDQSLRLRDFRAGELPPGPQGVPGPQGPAGAAGPVGTVDTSSFFTKGESDERFLARLAKAADAEKVDGHDGSVLMRGPLLVRMSAWKDAINANYTGGHASCVTGETVLSGGAGWSDGPTNRAIVEQRPDPVENQFNVTVFNSSGSTKQFRVYALCAKLDVRPPAPPAP